MKMLLNISYKGARQYLHGSDFFNALAELASEFTGDGSAFVERLAFHRFADTACVLVDAAPEDASQAVGQVRFRLSDGEQRNAWLVLTGETVTSRRPFDEDQLLAPATVDLEARCASLPARSVYTPIEEVIALTKHLNYAVNPDVKGKWLFGQLDLEAPLTGKYQRLEIHMKNLIPGRFSVNEIICDGKRIGVMRFIVGTQQ